MANNFVAPSTEWQQKREAWREKHQRYLRSWWWRKLVRPRCLKRDGYRCRICNSPDELQAHHRSYTWWRSWYFWREANDCTTLCREHHIDAHD
jgi:hypothetical protein